MLNLLSSPPVFAAVKISMPAMILIGAFTACVISLFTFANWRLGVKVAFVMVLFEGAIRKWVIPGAQELAYFTKDMFLIGAYLRFFFFPDPALRAWRLRVPTGVFMLLSVIVSFSALNPNIGSSILALYGMKIYFFYLPLVFMVPYLFTSQEDMTRNLFWYAMLATPICLLAVAQYARPGDNSLNVMAHGGEGTTMGWEGSKIRITGTFSYITGHATFVGIFFALHLALLMNHLEKWRWVCLLCNLPLLAGNALMNGSRASIAMLAFSGAGFFLASMFSKVGSGRNAFLKIVCITVLMALFAMLFFGEAKSQFEARVASASDNVQSRMVGMQLNSIGYAIQQGGMFGYGMGMTHPALDKLRSTLKIPRPRHIPPTYDTEVGQVLVELGGVGWVCWYLLRGVMLALSFAAFRETVPGLSRSLVVAAILIQLPHLLLGVVLNHTANFLVFAFFGAALIPLLKPAVERRFARGRSPSPAKLPPAAPALPGFRGSRSSPAHRPR